MNTTPHICTPDHTSMNCWHKYVSLEAPDGGPVETYTEWKRTRSGRDLTNEGDGRYSRTSFDPDDGFPY